VVLNVFRTTESSHDVWKRKRTDDVIRFVQTEGGNEAAEMLGFGKAFLTMDEVLPGLTSVVCFIVPAFHVSSLHEGF